MLARVIAHTLVYVAGTVGVGLIAYAIFLGIQAHSAPARPISAVAVVDCGEIAALVIQVDARTILRFTAEHTDLISIDHEQKTVKHAPPTPLHESLKIAETAIVQSTLYICDKPDDNQT